MTDEEAKKRMSVAWTSYVDKDAVLKALIQGDDVAIGEFKAKINAVDEYNEKMASTFDISDEAEKQRLINTYKHPII